MERKIDQQASKLQEVNLDNTFQQLSQDKHETQDQLDTSKTTSSVSSPDFNSDPWFLPWNPWQSKLCKNWTYFISFISASLHCSMISFPLAFCVLAAYSTIVRKHKQIQDQQEQIQRLKSAAIEMRDEQLQLIRDKQKQQHLEELSAEITARMEALTTEIRVLFIYLLLLFIYLILFLCKWKQIFNVAFFPLTLWSNRREMKNCALYQLLWRSCSRKSKSWWSRRSRERKKSRRRWMHTCSFSGNVSFFLSAAHCQVPLLITKTNESTQFK